MRNFLQYTIVLLMMLFIASCALFNKSPKSDKKSKEVIARSIVKAGGAEAMSKITELRYLKKVQLLANDGEKESELFEIHTYDLAADKGKIEWINNAVRSKLSYSGDSIEFTKNSQYDTTNHAYWREKRLASQKVLFMPWKLNDEGAVGQYKGLTTLDDSISVEIVEVSYPKIENNTELTWYYFDTKTGALRGYMIKNDNKYSYIQTVAEIEFKGIMLPSKRSSYRVDSLRNIQFPLAQYEYYNYR